MTEQDCINIETEILAAFDNLVQSAVSLNAASYFSHFDRGKFVGLNNEGSSWKSFAELSRQISQGFSAIKEVTSLNFTYVDVSIIDTYTAILVNEYTQSVRLSCNAELCQSGGGVQVWSKRTGSWKLVSVAASNKPR
ncbi:nuclear transport factor 2 family protein [Aestuariibacter salexigens]|uniref:nuclear transport factor 2 family protein n=1 Tax=Aestuariibacter salexigens TaxID=226010 RepID=UPI00146FAD24|nr:nuclear transport factor 2 family protein [Aestuariibacter salexigens]